MGDWTFFSNYGHVLVCLAKNHDARLRDVALEVGITERAVQKIVRDLQNADFVAVTKQGRCNRYRINKRKALRHQLEAKCTVGQLLSLVSRPGRGLQGSDSQDEARAAKPMAVPAAQLAPETEVATGSESAPGPTVDPEPEPPAESATPVKPVDTRQQGNLF